MSSLTVYCVIPYLSIHIGVLIFIVFGSRTSEPSYAATRGVYKSIASTITV